MIHFENLKFIPCEQGSNSVAYIKISEYDFCIVKKPVTRSYKVKPFDIIDGRKTYIPSLFQEYGEYPEFKGRDLLMVFLNEIDKINLSDITGDIDDDITEEEL